MSLVFILAWNNNNHEKSIFEYIHRYKHTYTMNESAFSSDWHFMRRKNKFILQWRWINTNFWPTINRLHFTGCTFILLPFSIWFNYYFHFSGNNAHPRRRKIIDIRANINNAWTCAKRYSGLSNCEWMFRWLCVCSRKGPMIEYIVNVETQKLFVENWSLWMDRQMRRTYISYR